MKPGDILVACEESQAVTIELRRLGVRAWSNDIIPCSGGHPEWHIKGDVREVLNKKWGGVIAFPPCTHLAVSGARCHKQKKADGRQQAAIDFFMLFVKADIPKKAIENPIGIMSTIHKRPRQIIHPYFFGDNQPKKTCLWLTNLPLLEYTPSQRVKPEYVVYNSKKNKTGKSKYSIFGRLGKGHGKERSKTFPGIARAMAEQWGPIFLREQKELDGGLDLLVH